MSRRCSLILFAAVLGVSAALALGAPSVGSAQGSISRSTTLPAPSPSAAFVGGKADALPRYTVGLDAGYARPRGAFAEHIRDGWGGSLYGVVYSAPGSPIGLRADAHWIVYGNESRIYPFATYLFGGYRLRETTSNNIFAFTVGPQFAINGGPFRPYVTVHGGVSYFSTSSSFSAQDVTAGYAPYVPSGDTYSDDWKLMYGGSAGVNIPLTRGRTPPMLDLGVTYAVNGRTNYLTKGDVQRDPSSGNVSIMPRQSDAHYITYRLGIAVALP